MFGHPLIEAVGLVYVALAAWVFVEVAFSASDDSGQVSP